MKTKKYLIVGNWKMNPDDPKTAKTAFSRFKKTMKTVRKAEAVICPPFPFLGFLKGEKGLSLGVQDVFHEERGAFTGFVGAKMSKACGADFAIVGHSERRAKGETDEDVSKKIRACLKEEIVPIVCVGESKRDLDGSHLTFLKNQIARTFAGIGRAELPKIVVAYEPVWAIGRPPSEAMKPIDIHESVIFIRKTLSDIYGGVEVGEVRILYGGSVDRNNAKSIIFEGEVDGLLVGRESLDPDGFSKILLDTNDGRK